MNFVADECIPRQIVDRRRADGHTVSAIATIASGSPDDVVLSLANQGGALLLTNDLDFGELVYRLGRTTVGVALLRLGGVSTRLKVEIVAAAVREHGDELPGAFSVITPGSVRIRRR